MFTAVEKLSTFCTLNFFKRLFFFSELSPGDYVCTKTRMNLTQLVNPNVSFSKTTLEDIVARYSVKAKSSTSTTNKTPASVRTAPSALGQAYARVHGNRLKTMVI